MAISFTKYGATSVQAKWGRARKATRPKPAPMPKLKNALAVLDLGSSVFFPFRGRMYRAPPLAWKDGQRLMLLWNEARTFEHPFPPRYFAILEQMTAELWRIVRPTGRLLRLFRRLHLLKNPFRLATEAELIERVLFLLSLRTRSGDGSQLLPRTVSQDPAT